MAGPVTTNVGNSPVVRWRSIPDGVKPPGLDQSVDLCLTTALSNLVQVFECSSTREQFADAIRACRAFSDGVAGGYRLPMSVGPWTSVFSSGDFPGMDTGSAFEVAMGLRPSHVGRSVPPGGGPAFLPSLLVCLEQLALIFPRQYLALEGEAFEIRTIDPEDPPLAVGQSVLLGAALGLITYVLGDAVESVELSATFSDEAVSDIGGRVSVPVRSGQGTRVFLKPGSLATAEAGKSGAAPCPEIDMDRVCRLLRVLHDTSDLFSGSGRKTVYDDYFSVLEGVSDRNLARFRTAAANLPVQDAAEYLLSCLPIRPYVLGVTHHANRLDWQSDFLKSLQRLNLTVPLVHIQVSKDTVCVLNRDPSLPPFYLPCLGAIGALIGLTEWTQGEGAIQRIQVHTHGDRRVLESLQKALPVPVEEGYPSTIFLNPGYENFSLFEKPPGSVAPRLGWAWRMLRVIAEAGFNFDPMGAWRLLEFMGEWDPTNPVTSLRQRSTHMIDDAFPVSSSNVQVAARSLLQKWPAVVENYLPSRDASPREALKQALELTGLAFPALVLDYSGERIAWPHGDNGIRPQHLSAVFVAASTVGLARAFLGEDAVVSVTAESDLRAALLDVLARELGVPVTRGEVMSVELAPGAGQG